MEKLIYSYRQKFAGIFKKERDKISKCVKDVEIHHIGSTSIPGLGGKGMVDMMIGIKSWQDLADIVEKLKKIGFEHIHPKEEGRVFLSKIGPTKLGDVHIHIVKINGKPYRELLAFRDYLRKHKKEVKRFFDLKLKWGKETMGDRKEYGRLKGKYVKEILRQLKMI